MQVLLAEHHKHSRRLLRHLLNQRHVGVIEADSGAECVAALRADVSLALIDWRLPPGEGQELFRELRRTLAPDRLYLVALVKASDEATLADALQAGADDTLALPASLEVVQRRLDVFLRIANRLDGRPTEVARPAPGVEADLVLNLVEAPAVAIDASRTLRHINAAFSELVGIPSELLIGLPAATLGLTESAVNSAAATILRPDGASVAVAVTPLPIAIRGEDVSVYICEPADADPDVVSAGDVERAEQQRGLYLMFERGGTIQAISDPLAELLGFDPTEVVGSGIRELLHPEDIAKLRDTLPRPDRAAGRAELRVRQRDGGWRTLRFSGRAMPPAAGTEGFVLIVRDDEREDADDPGASETTHTRSHALPDRRRFIELVNEALAATSGGHGCDVLVIGLDQAEAGRGAMSLSLPALAERLRAHVRQDDVLASVGPDQLAILAREVRDGGARAIAERILDDLRRNPVSVGGHEWFATAFIGFAHGAGPSVEAVKLLDEADAAMECVRETHRAGFREYRGNADLDAPESQKISAELAHAVERNELRVYYQPEVDLYDGRILGVEALVRWQHPARGLLLPSEFMSAAVSSDLINAIGEWVLDRATRDVAEWQRQLELGADFTVGVNVTASQLQQLEFVERTARALRRSLLEAPSLRIEVSEGMLLAHDAALVARLDQLSELGVSLAIDNVGVGDAALSYLQWFPARVIKIEQTLLAGSTSGSGRLATAQSIAAIARGVGVDLSVKGIDAAVQLKRVRSLGVSRGQGFYFSRPVSRETLAFLLAAGPYPFQAMLGETGPA